MRTLLTTLTLFITLSVSAQITVEKNEKSITIGKHAPMGITYAQISQTGEVCSFLYKDRQYTQINEYKSFVFLASDLETLYTLFTDLSGKKEGESITVNLELGESLRIEYRKSMGVLYADISHVQKSGVIGQLPYLTKRQTQKVFGQ